MPDMELDVDQLSAAVRDVCIPTPILTKPRKPPPPPIVGAWRVVRYQRDDATKPWMHSQRWLHDTDRGYKRMFKSKVTRALRLSEPFADGAQPLRDDVERITVEEYDGVGWYQIDDWIGPNPEQRILRGFRP